MKNDLDLRYLYAVLCDAPIDIEIRKFDKYETTAGIYEEIMDGNYEMVYMHCDSTNVEQLYSVAQMIHKSAPLICTVFGGMEVSFDTRDFMKSHPCVDYIIRGEGEMVLYNFVKAIIEQNYEFETMAGLAYRTNEGVVVNPFEDPVEMDELPFPYDKIDSGFAVACYESMRGTTDRTVNAQYLPDPRLRTISLDRVFTEIEYFLNKEVKRVIFLDKWFNFNSERAYRILEFIVNNDNGITDFEFNMNGDFIDDETIRMLSDARKGQITFNVDIGSTNPEVLDAMGRRCNVYLLMYNVTKLMNDGAVGVRLSITAGLPYETESMFARSFNKIYGLAGGMPIKIEQLCASKGTALRKQADRYGYVYSEVPPYEVIASGHMKPREILRIKKISRVVEAYVGDGGFKTCIPRMLNDTGARPYELFKSLSIYIQDEGLEEKLGKKENLARILYEFAEGMYAELSDARKLEMLRDSIHSDLEELIGEEAIKKFENKGWDCDWKGKN